MADERDRSIWAQNAGTTAASLLATITGGQPVGEDEVEGFLALFDVVRSHVYNGTIELTGLAIVQAAFPGAQEVAAPAVAAPSAPPVPPNNVVPLTPPPPPPVASPPPPPPAGAGGGVTFLDVPFAKKDLVKQLGARWDKDRRQWYVPAGADLTPFAAWT